MTTTTPSPAPVAVNDIGSTEEILAAVERILRERMGGAAELSVPLDVSIGRGGTWRDAAH